MIEGVFAEMPAVGPILSEGLTVGAGSRLLGKSLPLRTRVHQSSVSESKLVQSIAL